MSPQSSRPLFCRAVLTARSPLHLMPLAPPTSLVRALMGATYSVHRWHPIWQDEWVLTCLKHACLVGRTTAL